MLRMSSFSIISEELKGGGYALMNGLTGAIDLVSKEFVELLEHNPKYSNYKELYINEAQLPDTIRDSFLERGHLVTFSHKEELELLDEISEALHTLERSFANFLIVPDMDCNYRCTYCYERCIQNKLSGFKKTILTTQDIDTIYDVIRQIESSLHNTIEKRMITLYGGEPLNKMNFQQVEYIVAKGVQLGYTFKAITNGHDLDCYLPLLGTDKIRELQISIDGPKEIHDARRIVKDGTSSFEQVWKNLKLVSEQTDTYITIRSQVDSSNVLSYKLLLDLFKQEGWLNHSRFTFNAALVVTKDSDNRLNYSNTIKEITNILKPYSKAYNNVYIGCEEMNYEQEIYQSLLMDTQFKLRTSHCGATSGMYIFQPDGLINACFETLGDEYGTIGCYQSKDSISTYTIKENAWFQRLSTSIPECRDCPYCLICAGGCPNLAKSNTGDLNKPYCNGFKDMYPMILSQAVERYLQTYNL